MDGVQIIGTAHTHDVTSASIQHALRNPIRTFDLDGLAMIIGPDLDGTMLEVGVVEDDYEDRVIHAMPARRKFWP